MISKKLLLKIIKYFFSVLERCFVKYLFGIELFLYGVIFKVFLLVLCFIIEFEMELEWFYSFIDIRYKRNYEGCIVRS